MYLPTTIPVHWTRPRQLPAVGVSERDSLPVIEDLRGRQALANPKFAECESGRSLCMFRDQVAGDPQEERRNHWMPGSFAEVQAVSRVAREPLALQSSNSWSRRQS